MGRAIVVGEPTANQNFVVRLDHQRTDETISSQTEVDGWIDSAISVQARNPVASHTVGETELPAQEDFIIRLQSDGQYPIACASTWREGRVGSAIGIQPRNMAAGEAIHI